MNATDKIKKLNKRKPATIKQWYKYREEYTVLADQIRKEGNCPLDFKLGSLMPVIVPVNNLLPKGKAYLFDVFSGRFNKTIDENSVSAFRRGKWYTVSKGNHQIFIPSVAVFKGRKLEWLLGPADLIKTFILPEGWTWKSDVFGVMAVDSDGIDYHASFKSNDLTVEQIIEYHAKNKERRKNEIYQSVCRELAEKQLNTTFVLLEDSRRAGNCIEGSLSFAETMGLKRDDIISCPHLVSVKASRIFNHDYRAKNACYQAFMRETTISI